MLTRFIFSSALIFLAVNAASNSTSEKGDICLLGPLTTKGKQCLAYFEMFTFNAIKGRCELYVYGGCHASKNLFKRPIDCKNACQHLFKPPVDICMLGPMKEVSQTCKAIVPMFTFNPATAKCEKYSYGGCDGSENLFDTQEACKSACKHLHVLRGNIL